MGGGGLGGGGFFFLRFSSQEHGFRKPVPTVAAATPESPVLPGIVSHANYPPTWSMSAPLGADMLCGTCESGLNSGRYQQRRVKVEMPVPCFGHHSGPRCRFPAIFGAVGSQRDRLYSSAGQRHKIGQTTSSRSRSRQFGVYREVSKPRKNPPWSRNPVRTGVLLPPPTPPLPPLLAWNPKRPKTIFVLV